MILASQDVRIANLRTRILAIANKDALDSAELTLALAETLATVAVVLDLDSGGSKCALNDRLDEFVAHVRARHPEILREMVTRRGVTPRRT